MLGQISALRQELRHRQQETGVVGLATPGGAYLEFRGERNFDLVFESLDVRKSGIELRTVRTEDGITSATVFVPEGKIAYFVRRVESYLTEQTATGRPRHGALVESISEIRFAAIHSFWTDAADTFPNTGQAVWWEVWLRQRDEDPVTTFHQVAEAVGLRVDLGGHPKPASHGHLKTGQ